MALQILRAGVKPEHAADVEATIGKVFAALGELKPDGLRYRPPCHLVTFGPGQPAAMA